MLVGTCFMPTPPLKKNIFINIQTNEGSVEDNFFKASRPAGFFSRVLFYGFHLWLSKILGEKDIQALQRVVILIFALVFLNIIVLGFRVFDYYLIAFTPSYDRPSEVYGVDESGKEVLIAEFYRQARRPIKIINSKNSNLPKEVRANEKEILSSENNSAQKEILAISSDSRVVKTFLSSEDTRFYSHFGVDFQGIMRAIWTNLLYGKVKQGASTITQQVARMRFLSRERSLIRKVREATLAFLLELFNTKTQIIEDYLNMVPLGHGTNGVEAASRFYFNKSVYELSWGEVAVLASLTTRPREFSPIVNPNVSMGKVKVTLQSMVENGVIDVRQARIEFDNLKKDFYGVLNRSPNDSAFQQRLDSHPYATAYVRSQLPLELRSDDVLSTMGLKIYTSIVVPYQLAAENQMIPYLKELTTLHRKSPFKFYNIFDSEFDDIKTFTFDFFDLPPFKVRMNKTQRDFSLAFDHEWRDELSMMALFGMDSNVSDTFDYHLLYGEHFSPQQGVEGGLVSIRPFTGEITSVVGGSGFSPRNQQLRFDNIRRQPGSAFKPLVIASAFEASLDKDNENKITAASIFDDTPLHFINTDLSEYSPENYSGSYEGNLRLRRALTLSKNSVTIQVYRRAGAEMINGTIEKLLQLDISNPPKKLPIESTVALGSYGLSPLQMARAYAVFASHGQEVNSHIIKRIVDINNKVIFDYDKTQKDKKPRQIIDPNVAELMVSMLRDVVEHGTGTAARIPGRDVVGKTGTTNRSTDTWFVGFTPELVTAVYIGYDKPISLGSSSTGGGVAAPVWGRYMFHALKRLPPKSFEFENSQLKRIEICEDTGVLAGPHCSERIWEYFLPGTNPNTSQSSSSKGLGRDDSDNKSNDSEEDVESILNDKDLKKF